MERHLVGTVKALWRYPVKSMLGEQVRELAVATLGAAGDRACALRDCDSKRIASAKKFPQLLTCRAAYEQATLAPDGLGPLSIRLPGGIVIDAAAPDASRVVSEALGHDFELEHTPRPAGERAGIDPRTVFGDVPFEQLFAGITAERAPDYYKLASGTFLDSAPIHLIATGTLDHLRGLAGGKCDFDYRRFRPNVLIEAGNDERNFVEDGWLGGTLQIGESARIGAMRPALRCVMTTHPQQDIPRDLAIMRTAAAHHQANVGVFASVEVEGLIRVGDQVHFMR